MSYIRVIPRDLFNEANLLKCLGQLALYLLDHPIDGVSFELDQDSVQGFDVIQRQSDGAIYVDNLPFIIRREAYRLTRPLNTRRPWPIYAERMCDDDFEPVAVFSSVVAQEGRFSPEFYELLTGIAQS